MRYKVFYLLNILYMKNNNDSLKPQADKTISLKDVDLNELRLSVDSKMRNELRELLSSENHVSPSKILIFFKYFFQKNVSVNDQFFDNVFTEDFIEGVEDFIMFFRMATEFKDEDTKKEGLKNCVESLITYLFIAVSLAKESWVNSDYASIEMIEEDINITSDMVSRVMSSSEYNLDSVDISWFFSDRNEYSVN